MVKYPGGTPGRWEKVACDMGRSVKDVSTLLNTCYTCLIPRNTGAAIIVFSPVFGMTVNAIISLSLICVLMEIYLSNRKYVYNNYKCVFIFGKITAQVKQTKSMIKDQAVPHPSKLVE